MDPAAPSLPFGFATIAAGSLSYGEMAVDMALSLRQFHDDPVLLLADAANKQHVERLYPGVFDRIVLASSRYLRPITKKFALANLLPLERGFFIDADTIVLGPLEAEIKQTRRDDIVMMGHYLPATTDRAHHGIPIRLLCEKVGTDRFFTCHSGALGYSRDRARAFFDEALEIFTGQLDRFYWRRKGFVGDELAFGLAAAKRQIARFDAGDPVFWPDELASLSLAAPGKPLCHLYTMPPENVFRELLAQIRARREKAGFPTGRCEMAWRRKQRLKARKPKAIVQRLGNACRRPFRLMSDAPRSEIVRPNGGAKPCRAEGTEQRDRLPVLLSARAPVLCPPGGRLGAQSVSNPTSTFPRVEDLMSRKTGTCRRTETDPGVANETTKTGQAMYQKVYHHHLKKCGGTSMNQWLDSHFAAYPDNFRQIQTTAYRAYPDEPNQFVKQRKRMQAFAQAIFAARDLCHDHAELAALVPHGTFRFTVLRNPADRLLSQIRDYRRLAETTVAAQAPALREILTDLRELSIKDALEKHDARRPLQFHNFDNYVTRSLAQVRIGDLARSTPDPGALLPAAMEALERDFEFVGLLEEDALTRNILCAHLGWVPPRDVLVRNRTDRSTTPTDEVREADEIIAKLTATDAVLYAHARKLFEVHRDKLGRYDQSAFEAGPVAQRMAQLRAHTDATMLFYTMDQPINATGHSGRHTNPAGHSWIWTSNSAPFVLYMPVPSHQEVTLSLRYVDTEKQGLDKRLSVFVNGSSREYRLREGNGTTRWIDVDHDTDLREFARIELRFGSDQTPKKDFTRGLLIDQYGWRLRAID